MSDQRPQGEEREAAHAFFIEGEKEKLDALKSALIAAQEERDKAKDTMSHAWFCESQERERANKAEARVEELEGVLGEIAETYTLNEGPAADGNNLRMLAVLALKASGGTDG